MIFFRISAPRTIDCLNFSGDLGDRSLLYRRFRDFNNMVRKSGGGPSLESMQAYAAKCQREHEMTETRSTESTEVPEEPAAEESTEPEPPRKRIQGKGPEGGAAKRPRKDAAEEMDVENEKKPKDTRKVKEKVKPKDDKEKEKVKPKDDKEKVKPKDDKENEKVKRNDKENVKPKDVKEKEKVKPKDVKETEKVKPKDDDDEEKVKPKAKASKEDKEKKGSKRKDAKNQPVDGDADGTASSSKKAKDIVAVLTTAGDLPCEVSWKNLKTIQKHFGLTEAETASCLLSVLGPDPEMDEFWTKYKKPSPEKSPVEISDDVLPESNFDPTRHSSIRSTFGDEDEVDEDMEGEEEEADEDDDELDGEGLTMSELKASVVPPLETPPPKVWPWELFYILLFHVVNDLGSWFLFCKQLCLFFRYPSGSWHRSISNRAFLAVPGLVWYVSGQLFVLALLKPCVLHRTSFSTFFFGDWSLLSQGLGLLCSWASRSWHVKQALSWTRRVFQWRHWDLYLEVCLVSCL